MRSCTWILSVATCVCLALPSASAEDKEKPQAKKKPTAEKKYLLRYKFHPGETVRWEVEHRAEINTTVQGSTQTAETLSRSVKAWKVLSVDKDGQVEFEHAVEKVDMRQKLSGRQEVHYNSETDSSPPGGYEHIAAAVNVPLSRLKLDARGQIVSREVLYKEQRVNEGQVTLPLPEQAIAIGEKWSYEYEKKVPLPENAGLKSVKLLRQYRLEKVEENIATIRITTAILTPGISPTIEAQLIEEISDGSVTIDVEAGRIRTLQTDLDRTVIGFQGDSSRMQYVTRFQEKLLTGEEQVASRPKREASQSVPLPPEVPKSAEKSKSKKSASTPSKSKTRQTEKK